MKYLPFYIPEYTAEAARVGCGERREPHRSRPIRFVPQRILRGLGDHGGIFDGGDDRQGAASA
ncbi:hypothetical protein BH20PSE1_BH20PSE1_23920 [soil metagenome]